MLDRERERRDGETGGGGVKITNDDELRCIKRQREKERKITKCVG